MTEKKQKPRSEKLIRRLYMLLVFKKFGTKLFNNAVGFDSKNGVKYGLMNGSADDIGITPIKITQKMVGKTIGVFTSIEGKREGWRPPLNPPDRKKAKSQASYLANKKKYDHHIEQVTWMKNIQKDGGIAGFASTPEEAEAILNRFIDKIMKK